MSQTNIDKSKICVEKKDIIKALENSKSLEEASQVLNISPTTLSRRIKEYDIKKEQYLKNSKTKIILTLDEILDAQSKTNSASSAARYLNVSAQTYQRRATELGVYTSNQGLKGGKKPKSPEIDLRTYTCNDNVFSVLTKESAYWLGFITADGHIREKKNAICIVLKREDKGHLEHLKAFLNFTGPVFDRVRVLNEIEYPISEITVFSKQIVKDLVNKYGLSHIKTYKEITTISFIPESLRIYFCMGYFDADGNISKLDGFCSICSKKETVLQEIYKTLKKYNIESKIKYSELKKSFTLSINYTSNIYNFLELYLKIGEDISILRRKKLIAEKYFRYNGYT